ITAALAFILPSTFADRDTSKFVALVDSWWGNNGLWGLLAFSMQMALVLVTGYALAASKPIRAVIDGIASIPHSTTSGAMVIAFVAVFTGLINWGLALVVGALLARAVGRSLEQRRIPCHYPLLAAAGYVGLLVWHGGFSGSAPLSMTTPEGAAKVLPAEVAAEFASTGIPLADTILSPMNLVTSLGMLAIAPLFFLVVAPRRAEDHLGPTDLGVAPEAPPKQGDESGAVSIALGIGLGVALIVGFAVYAWEQGINRLGLNQINAVMLGLGLIFHGSPSSYLRAIEDAARGCAGIIVQFPLYAGVMGIMAVSGMLAMFAQFASEHSTPSTLPLFTFVSAGVVNIFVPSGGGQWAVQGPIALSAGLENNVPIGKMVMSVAYGDQLTNMLQPFWALPLLAITGVRARDIVGYTALLMCVAAVWMAFNLLIF
ncbi:MAG: TIGR00366 family protein, partial [Phycisphaerales bacterium]|nr:TIGR00366 family protein [Phycisphaerales bacterium]